MSQQSIVSRGRILIVEDSPSIASLYVGILENDGYEALHVPSAEDALRALTEGTFDVMLLDLELPGMSGTELLDRLRESSFAGAVVVITAHGSVEVAVECMAKGVLDFIEKPVSAPRLSLTVSNAQRQTQLQTQVRELRATYQPNGFESFVGASKRMQAVYTLIRSAAPSRAPIFIVGESGTGKELCAEAVHRRSDRANEPFVVLNCAAIPRDLMESEIFGHVKGAFTGATADRTGAAERADGGTLFLDEICEMPIELQSKLLRFLQTGAVQKVGGANPHTVDVRFVCATNRNPRQEVERGNFREDLFYRLHVIEIPLPPLREREEDVITLAEHFLHVISQEESKAFTSFDAGARAWVLAQAWPGNVRELQNWVRNIVVLNDGDTVTTDMIPQPRARPASAKVEPSADADGGTSEAIEAAAAAAAAARPIPVRPLWEEEKAIIERAIAQCDGNVQRAAAALEVSPSTIYRKKQAWRQSAT